MKKADRAKIVSTMLNDLFPDPAIPLKHKDSYTLLIAVLLSAQCTDARVNMVTPALFEAASTPKDMANLPLEAIEHHIRTCGLTHTKAKHIKALSQILVEEYASEVPDSLTELMKLPGVGRKTASVVLAQAFNQPAIGVDTHILRCTKRWKLSKSRTPLETENDLAKLYPKSMWQKIHLQIIYYGRAYCPAKGHQIETCPICQALVP